MRAPREWLEGTTNLVSHHELDRGGHFAPFEQPDLFVDELHAFLEPFRR